MQLCLTVICWAQRWVEERGARQVLLGVSAKWPSTCQYQVSGREGEGERACMCDISVERKRWDCCCRMKREDAVDFFFLYHITAISYVLKMHLQTPPYLWKGDHLNLSVSLYRVGFFPGLPMSELIVLLYAAGAMTALRGIFLNDFIIERMHKMLGFQLTDSIYYMHQCYDTDWWAARHCQVEWCTHWHSSN